MTCQSTSLELKVALSVMGRRAGGFAKIVGGEKSDDH